MSTTLPRAAAVSPVPPCEPAEELYNGDRMTREEFHRAYTKTSQDFKAELIGGTVFVALPVSRRHGRPHILLGSVLAAYEGSTPGVEASDNETIFLGDDSEPQPDLYLRILPEHGGQSEDTVDEDYVVGAPELVIEVAHSSKAIDLHAKRADYARYGVKEYLVWIGKDGVFAWFDLSRNEERALPSDFIVRSLTFPGLWIDGHGLLATNYARLTSTLNEGLSTPEHAEFVARLAAAKK